MKSKLNILLIVVLFFLGFSTGIFSFGYRVLILGDIPVSYTTSEALVAQISFFISTLLLLFALVSSNHKIVRYVTAGIFTLVFLFHLNVFPNSDMWESSYDSSIAQLELAPVLHAGLLMIFNYFLIVQQLLNKER